MSSTRFARTPVYGDHFGLWERPEFRRFQTVHIVQPGEEGALDLISFNYYGTHDYWWAIAVANDILYPLEEVIPGKKLKIPYVEDIEDWINASR